MASAARGSGLWPPLLLRLRLQLVALLGTLTPQLAKVERPGDPTARPSCCPPAWSGAWLYCRASSNLWDPSCLRKRGQVQGPRSDAPTRAAFQANPGSPLPTAGPRLRAAGMSPRGVGKWASPQRQGASRLTETQPAGPGGLPGTPRWPEPSPLGCAVRRPQNCHRDRGSVRPSRPRCQLWAHPVAAE